MFKAKNIKIFIIIMGIIVVIGYMAFFFAKDPFTKKKYTNSDFQIEDYHSMIDKDQDGIDDQTDILKNVEEYIKTNPKYKSKYYETGYPNDQYGVCTDVVAEGLLGAGYDLMELVNQDILEHREDYDIEIIDKNIDFRRVKNLKVYFKNNAISLTTDPSKIEEWQGGDIVIFEKHIGVVSEHRNKEGIPYIYHHANPYQLKYEEDILKNRKDIVGHYRIS